MTPFFSIITRTMRGREALLERCQASVNAQTFQGEGTIEHLILRDEIGVGVAAAQQMMWTASPRGEYVFVLDDDDYLSAPDVLSKLYDQFVGLFLGGGLVTYNAAFPTSRPLFAVVKVAHGLLGTMPLDWGMFPDVGRITVSNVVVENVQWFIHRNKFTPDYNGDYSWVASLFAAHTPVWIDLNLVTVEEMRNGAVASAVNPIWATEKVMA